jgi:hypothetical protein
MASTLARWPYWLPTVGTMALLVLGYCLMAPTLSLLPWNHTGRLTFDLLSRTFLSAPVAARSLVPQVCGAADGVCELEWRAGEGGGLFGYRQRAKGQAADAQSLLAG